MDIPYSSPTEIMRYYPSHEPAYNLVDNERPSTCWQFLRQEQQEQGHEVDALDYDDEDIPQGFPYADAWGIWCFVYEYLKGMQALVSECMEGRGRYGSIRHTT